MDSIKNKNDSEKNPKKSIEVFNKNTKVFILPPELLNEMGINIESYQNIEPSGEYHFIISVSNLKKFVITNIFSSHKN